jgi:hypothetical protein
MISVKFRALISEGGRIALNLKETSILMKVKTSVKAGNTSKGINPVQHSE